MSITPFFHVYHKYVFNMANINKIKISGTTYSIQDENACNVVELTQAQYDALPATAKTSNSLFVITDAQGADLSNYYTKSETSGATEISTALGNKQDTLVSGTNIKTINNESILGSGNITIEGGGGGSSYQAGTNISIDNDTINCTLPLRVGLGYNSIYGGDLDNNSCWAQYGFAYGDNADCGNSGSYCMAFGSDVYADALYAFITGKGNTGTNDSQAAFGQYTVNNQANTTWGDSGNTLLSVGNGIDGNSRHNAFEIRQNGDIYIPDTNDTSTANYYEKPMIKLQDALGGSSYTAGDGIDITNDVISVTGKVETSAITTSMSSSSTDSQVPSAKAVYDQFGGLKLVKLSQSEYDALSPNYDSNTLYVIVN